MINLDMAWRKMQLRPTGRTSDGCEFAVRLPSQQQLENCRTALEKLRSRVNRRSHKLVVMIPVISDLVTGLLLKVTFLLGSIWGNTRNDGPQ